MDGYRKTVLYVGLLGQHMVSQHRNQKAGFATLLRETVSPVTVSGTKGNGEDVTRSSGTHRPGSGDNNVLRCLVLLTLDVRHCEYQ